MSNKIIIEGIDGAGKTTFINKIIEENPDINYQVVHCTRHTENNYQYFKSLLDSEDNIIFDRFCFGQWVYQSAEDRKRNKWLNLSELIMLCDLIKEMISNEELKIYYVHADYDVCLYNCLRDQEDSYYTLDYIKELDIKFRHVFSMIDLSVIDYYNDYHPFEDSSEEQVDAGSVNYEDFPKICAVDFDGTIAKNAFPDINLAVPNVKLIEYLKFIKRSGVKLILWTNRTDQYLIDACNYCADQGLYFDSINDNIEEVKKSLSGGPRKVYADEYIDDKAVTLTDIGADFPDEEDVSEV